MSLLEECGRYEVGSGNEDSNEEELRERGSSQVTSEGSFQLKLNLVLFLQTKDEEV